MTLISNSRRRSGAYHGWFPLLPSIGVTIAAVGLPRTALADAFDWPMWRGPLQNSSSTEKNLVEEWNPKGGENSNLLWKRSDLGTRSTPVVLGNRLFVLCRDKPGTATEGEKVVCVDATTGEQLWQHRFNVYLTDTPDTRVGWSSVTADPETGRVYAQGVCGYFCCLEGDTGKVVWDRSLHEEIGVITTYGGRTNIPVIFEDLVLISSVVVGWGDTPEFDNLARPSHRFMAFDKATGELRWLGGTTISPPDTSYSTPTIAVINGEAQLIFGGSDGIVWSLQPRTGKPLWWYPFSRHGLNVSPTVADDTVYMAHGLENMEGTTKGAVVAIDAKLRGDLAGREKWLTYNIPATRGAPILVDGNLWIIDDGAKLYVLNPDNGDILTKKALGSRQTSTPLFADGKVYACTEAGRWWVLKPKSDGGVEVIDDVRLQREEVLGSPIVSRGRIYFPTSSALFCIGDKDVEPSADPLPEPPEEISLGHDPAPALVQVSPYDALVKPGDSQRYTVRLFNSRGQLIRAAGPDEVQFRVQGPGRIAADGTYTAPRDASHEGALIYCKVGELEGKARARIVPTLPWRFDFNDGESMPISWIGGRVRYVPAEIDGEKAALKLDVLPTPRDSFNKLGTRSPMYMGPADMSNYTVQADVRLTEKDGRLPDVFGLVNSGYTLGIRPGDKQLSVYSWASHDFRASSRIDFEPKPDVWYRLKLRVDQQDGKAICRGKLWLRDQSEPDEWSLELVDGAPQESGSPGLFGNTQTTSFYVDNLIVEPNK